MLYYRRYLFCAHTQACFRTLIRHRVAGQPSNGISEGGVALHESRGRPANSSELIDLNLSRMDSVSMGDRKHA